MIIEILTIDYIRKSPLLISDTKVLLLFDVNRDTYKFSL